MKKFIAGIFVLFGVFACNPGDKQPPPYPGNPYPSTSPVSPVPQPTVQIQSGNLTFGFSRDHLALCDVSTQLDGTLSMRVEFEDKDASTLFLVNLQKVDPRSGEHRTTDFMSGWIYIRVPGAGTVGDREYRVVYYDLDSNRSTLNSDCITRFTGVTTDVLSGSFSCKRLYNSRKESRDFQGNFQCNIKRIAP